MPVGISVNQICQLEQRFFSCCLTALSNDSWEKGNATQCRKEPFPILSSKEGKSNNLQHFLLVTLCFKSISSDIHYRLKDLYLTLEKSPSHKFSAKYIRSSSAFVALRFEVICQKSHGQLWSASRSKQGAAKNELKLGKRWNCWCHSLIRVVYQEGIEVLADTQIVAIAILDVHYSVGRPNFFPT